MGDSRVNDADRCRSQIRRDCSKESSVRGKDRKTGTLSAPVSSGRQQRRDFFSISEIVFLKNEFSQDLQRI